MDIFQFFIISALIIVCIFLILYAFYMFLENRKQKEEEPILTNLMIYQPPVVGASGEQ